MKTSDERREGRIRTARKAQWTREPSRAEKRRDGRQRANVTPRNIQKEGSLRKLKCSIVSNTGGVSSMWRPCARFVPRRVKPLTDRSGG
eukprot:scaffold363_cov331-Pavlova_lutheri.AAC.47